MGDPIFGFINVAFKLGELAVSIAGVGGENAVFVRMINRVRRDMDEAERLIRVPAVLAKLVATPEKLPWIKDVILSTKHALNDIGKWVDRARAEKLGLGSVTFETRIRWVFNDHQAVVARKEELAACHQSLSTALNILHMLEPTKPTDDFEPPQYTDVTSLDELLSPRQRRKISKPTIAPSLAEAHQIGSWSA